MNYSADYALTKHLNNVIYKSKKLIVQNILYPAKDIMKLQGCLVLITGQHACKHNGLFFVNCKASKLRDGYYVIFQKIKSNKELMHKIISIRYNGDIYRLEYTINKASYYYTRVHKGASLAHEIDHETYALLLKLYDVNLQETPPDQLTEIDNLIYKFYVANNIVGYNGMSSSIEKVKQILTINGDLKLQLAQQKGETERLKADYQKLLKHLEDMRAECAKHTEGHDLLRKQIDELSQELAKCKQECDDLRSDLASSQDILSLLDSEISSAYHTSGDGSKIVITLKSADLIKSSQDGTVVAFCGSTSFYDKTNKLFVIPEDDDYQFEIDHNDCVIQCQSQGQLLSSKGLFKAYLYKGDIVKVVYYGKSDLTKAINLKISH